MMKLIPGMTEPMLMETDDKEAEGLNSPIVNFYKDKSVFITGATGFMGKVLVEKLLRSTGVKKIYLLIRTKKGVPTNLRLKDLLSAPLFDKVKGQGADLESRVECISGDITLPGFGITPEDERLLIENVSVIFHSAATIRFDEKLTQAMKLNVEAVQTVMGLGKKMQKLEALVHVSTAYCNPQLEKVPEEICQDNGDPASIISLCQLLDPDVVDSLTPTLIGKKPNTYTYTKALGESILQSEGGSLPIAIMRPSMVVAAWREPIAGWIENLAGPTGMLAGTGKGVVRSMVAKRDMVADFIPVDVCINLLIAIAWRTATKPVNPIPVYNCTSGSTKPMTWAQLQPLWSDTLQQYPFEGVYRYPYVVLRESVLMDKICKVLLHSLPAHIMDFASKAVGGKVGLVRAVNKMHKSQGVLQFFTTHGYEFAENNLKSLLGEMNEFDRRTFNFDLTDLNWSEFLPEWIKGTRQYVFKENLSTLPVAKKHVDKLYWGENLMMVFVVLFFLRLLWHISEFFSYSEFSFLT